VVLLQWPYLKTILQFPDRPTFGTSLNASEIGFKLNLPASSGPLSVTGPLSGTPAKPQAAKAAPAAKPATAGKTSAKPNKTKGAKRG
jgi:hypothetical protein